MNKKHDIISILSAHAVSGGSELLLGLECDQLPHQSATLCRFHPKKHLKYMPKIGLKSFHAEREVELHGTRNQRPTILLWSTLAAVVKAADQEQNVYKQA